MISPANAATTPSVTLDVGGRTLIVEATPLAKSRLTRLGVVVDQPRDNVLRLRSHSVLALTAVLSFSGLLIALLLLATLFVMAMVANPHRESTGAWALLGFAVAPCLVGLTIGLILLRKPRAVFSRESKRLRFVAADRKPLGRATILAIQIIAGRADQDLREHSATFQINLILDDRELSRVGFITVRDAAWTREAGSKLADYLGVPLVDRVTEDAADQAADGSHATEAVR
jgi:hypothetical protein